MRLVGVFSPQPGADLPTIFKIEWSMGQGLQTPSGRETKQN